MQASCLEGALILSLSTGTRGEANADILSRGSTHSQLHFDELSISPLTAHCKMQVLYPRLRIAQSVPGAEQTAK